MPRSCAWCASSASSRLLARVGGGTASPSTALQTSNSVDGVTGLTSSAPTETPHSARRRCTASRLNAVSISTAGVGWRPPARSASRFAHSMPSRPGIFQSSSTARYGLSPPSASATARSASSPSAAVSACRPSAALIAARISRAVALSSTISTRVLRRIGSGQAGLGGSDRILAEPSETVNVEPLPSPAAATAMLRRPSAATTARLIASPSPVPP